MTDYRTIASQYAQQYGIPQELFLRQIGAESAWNPSAVSSAGALGLAQLMPSTARALGVDLLNPVQNLEGGARYLRQQYDKFGDWGLALAAYNAGPGRVEQYGGIPPFEETQNYVAKILGDMQQGRGGAMTPQQQRQQRPQGLLEQIGLQRMGTGGPQGDIPFHQRDKFRDFAGRLAIAANTLRQRPDPNIPAAVQAAQQQRKGNRTLDWLAQQPGGERFAELGRVAGPAVALQEYMNAQAAPAPTKGVAVDGRIVNPITGEVIYEPEAGAYDPEALSALRKEFIGIQSVKDFSKQAGAYGRVMASVEDPSAAGDLALIFNYMKVLDPGSVVREGEFATAQNAGGVDQRVRSLYNNIIEGTRLTEGQRADFADRATRLYRDAEDQFTALRDQYQVIAEAGQLPIELALPSFAYSGEMFQMPLKFTPPPAPAGVDAATWPQVWQEMTEEERREFING